MTTFIWIVAAIAASAFGFVLGMIYVHLKNYRMDGDDEWADEYSPPTPDQKFEQTWAPKDDFRKYPFTLDEVSCSPITPESYDGDPHNPLINDEIGLVDHLANLDKAKRSLVAKMMATNPNSISIWLTEVLLHTNILGYSTPLTDDCPVLTWNEDAIEKMEIGRLRRLINDLKS